ncbi:minor tail protein [Mycobacterium phage Indlulamithi]|uniref:Minor tail protein n=1 Tax=Mycobacterium phage Indlulamithi TaxID=2656582 RepID=A0A649VCN0_9CAUD|nr:minor tail protein [Mycobacterium phage Indlulamithi]QGJ90066.1 minor tail protein [Mycobacterium phage Indlulamithi]
MPINKNLEPGQYQIGDLVMGPFTPFAIESIDIGNYDVNSQDTQSMMSDEIRFGQDTFKPSPLQLTINVQVNRMVENVAAMMASVPQLNFADDPNLHDLQREWRAPETLKEWGAIKPLLFCGGDGITRQFYGRPGKFTYKKHRQAGSLFYQCQAEFRRSDTFAYSDKEFYVDFAPNVPQTLTRTIGTAPSWVRFFIVGPANHPVINWGTKQIELDWNVEAGQIVEISSYPWQRRVVDNTGLSLAARIVTDRPYLDSIYFNDHEPKLISWTATGTNAVSKMRVLWHDGWQVMD